jgi:hypothetical protein
VGSPRNANETAYVGVDLAMPVFEAIGAEGKSRFTGRIHEVFLDLESK